MKNVVGLAAAVGLLMGVADPDRAITWGTFDGDDHPLGRV